MDGSGGLSKVVARDPGEVVARHHPVFGPELREERVQDTELMMAGALLTVLPVIVLYALLQRYYIEGIMLGSIKG